MIGTFLDKKDRNWWSYGLVYGGNEKWLPPYFS